MVVLRQKRTGLRKSISPGLFTVHNMTGFLTHEQICLMCYVQIASLNKQGRFITTFSKANTARNTIITPNFLVWRFCGMAQFLHNIRPIARNYAETVPFLKISTTKN